MRRKTVGIRHARRRSATASSSRAPSRGLRVSARSWAGLFDSIADGLVLVSLGGVIEYCNAGFHTMIGHERGEVIGADHVGLIPEKWRSAEKEVLDNEVVPHSRSGLHYRAYLHKNGSSIPVEVRSWGVTDGEGRLTGYWSIVRDVTEREKAAVEIAELNEELKVRIRELTEVNAELASFAYSVSHDLRAPLRVMDGFSQALQEDYAEKLVDQARHYLSRIMHGASRMGHLIDDLLRLSRVSSAEIEVEDVDLAALVREEEPVLRAAHPDKDVELVVGEGLVVRGDKRLLGIVIANLLDNAWKFSSTRERPRVEVGVTTDASGQRTFFVKDNGVGFDPTYAGKMFAPFQRFHRMDTFPGNGIGLATVRRVINRHRGTITAESVPDKGAVFRFTVNTE